MTNCQYKGSNGKMCQRSVKMGTKDKFCWQHKSKKMLGGAGNTQISIMKIPDKLATINNISQIGINEISQTLNTLIADAFALYVKTKNYHWHLSGVHFRDYHLLFDEQATQIYNSIDILAERVRKLGGLTIHSIGEIAKKQTIPDDNDIYVVSDIMVERLLAGNAHMSLKQKEAIDICDKYKDYATSNILQTLVDETERRNWFLFEINQQI